MNARTCRIVLPVLALLLPMALLPGCGTGERISDLDLRPLRYPEAVQRLQDENTVLVDVRPHRQFRAGHIEDAVNVPLPELSPRHPEIAPYETVIVYSQNLEDPLAPAASKKLLQQGHGRVFTFRGGLEEWQTRGGPVSAEQANAAQDAD